MAKGFDKEAGEVDFYWLGEIWGLGVNMHVHEWEIREHEVTTLASHRQWEGKGEGYKCKLWTGELVGLIWLGWLFFGCARHNQITTPLWFDSVNTAQKSILV